MDWDKVEKMVGLPDYAVIFAVWPWPDGGWKASIALLDKDYAQEQNLPKGILELEPWYGYVPPWDVDGGFSGGIDVHESTATEAVEALWEKVNK